MFKEAEDKSHGEVTTKRCTGCGEEKPFDQYGKHKTGRFGLKSKCKPCTSAIQNIRYQKKKKEMDAYHAEWREKNADHLRKRESAAAKKRRADPEKRKKLNAYQKQYLIDNPDVARKRKETSKIHRNRPDIIQKKKDGWKTYRHGYMSRPTTAAKGLFTSARKRAKKMGWDCDITEEWVLSHIERGTCSVTGMKFHVGVGYSPWAPSLDRKDGSKGYTKDNVQIVVWMYNSAKNQFAHADVLLMCEALISKEGIST